MVDKLPHYLSGIAFPEVEKLDKTVGEVMNFEAVFDRAVYAARGWYQDAMNYTDLTRRQLRLDHAKRMEEIALSAIEGSSRR